MKLRRTIPNTTFLTALGLNRKTEVHGGYTGGSRLRSKTVQFKQARRELPHNLLGAGSTWLKFSMSSIKRDVKKEPLPRPEAEKICVSRSSPLTVCVPLDLLERFCSGWFAIPVGFIFRW